MAMELLAEGLTGGVGGFVGRSAAFPFDTLKVKLATSDGVGPIALVKQTLRQEGLSGLYRGLPFSAVEALYQKFLYISFFTSLKRRYKIFTGKDAHTIATLLCGYFSELASVPFSVPIEAMVVRLQSAPLGSPWMPIIHEALFTRRGLFGALATGRVYLVLAVKPGIEFAVFERIKRSMLQVKLTSLASPMQQLDLPPLTAFFVGAIARAVATVIVYPYVRGKALLQAKLAPGAVAGIVQVFQTQGFLALYRGLGMELSRGMTQAAIMFAVMEQIRALVRRAILETPQACGKARYVAQDSDQSDGNHKK